MTTYKVGQVLTRPNEKHKMILLFKDDETWFYKWEDGFHGFIFEKSLQANGWTPQEDPEDDQVAAMRRLAKKMQSSEEPQEIEELERDYDLDAKILYVINKVNELVGAVNGLRK